jgi:hypothetical protein
MMAARPLWIITLTGVKGINFRLIIKLRAVYTFETLHLEFRKQILTGNVSSPLKVGGTRLCCGKRE